MFLTSIIAIAIIIVVIEIYFAGEEKDMISAVQNFYVIVANKQNTNGSFEVRRQVLLATDPDNALVRWAEEYGSGWNIELVTLNYDLADKVYGTGND